MSERKSLKLRLPSHHVYDTDYDWNEKFEAPRSNNNAEPVQRRKISKSVKPPGTTNATFTVPDTPPTPENNTKLYPFLRLHRQMSTSTPDLTKLDPSERRQSFSRVKTEVNFCKNDGNQSKSRLLDQVAKSDITSSQGRNFSDTVLQRGLTALTGNEVSTDKKNFDNSTNTPAKMHTSEREHHDYNSALNNRRTSPTGFLSNLIFGNNLFDGKPLKVSAFDMTMCAPGST